MDVKESIRICHSKVEDSREAHDVVFPDLQAGGTRTFEMKRKADDAQDQIRAHTKEFGTAEEDLNDSPYLQEALDLVEDFQMYRFILLQYTITDPHRLNTSDMCAQ